MSETIHAALKPGAGLPESGVTDNSVEIINELSIEYLPTSIYDQQQQALFEAIAATPLDDRERSELFKNQTLFELARGNEQESSRLARHVTEYKDKLDIFVAAMEAGDDILVLELGDLRAEAESSGDYGKLVDYLIAETRLGFNVGFNIEAANTLMNDRSLNIEAYGRRRSLYDAVADLVHKRIDQGRLEEASGLINHLGDNRDTDELKVYWRVKQVLASGVLPKEVSKKLVRSTREKVRAASYERRWLGTATAAHVSTLLQWHAVHPDPSILVEVSNVLRQGTPGSMAYSIFAQEAAMQEDLREARKKDPTSCIPTLLKWGQWDQAKKEYERSIEEGFTDQELLPLARAMALYHERHAIQEEDVASLSKLMASIDLTEVERSARAREVIVGDIVDESRFRQLFNKKVRSLFDDARKLPDIAQRFTALSHLVELQIAHDTSSASNVKDIKKVMAQTAGTILSSRLALLTISEQEVRSRLDELGIKAEPGTGIIKPR